ncbi:MAG: hypothetical protein JRJ23_01345 [Deltaproteobacteria bacterium]|nr:hypothetical protein [Deltaproteobacteria bacterium]MBW1915467.1 hypothetical protein [Deltaproteobacteria bacterium]
MKSFVLFVILTLMFTSGIAVRSGICEEKCPLQVKSFSPKMEAEIRRPDIYVILISECGAAIDISSIKMLFNNEPVVHEISSNQDGSEVKVSFTPYNDLYDIYDIVVSGSDVNGNTIEKKWTFEVPYWL